MHFVLVFGGQYVTGKFTCTDGTGYGVTGGVGVVSYIHNSKLRRTDVRYRDILHILSVGCERKGHC